jgi:NAD(P)-dependent dehydrogenase (short-subunit alcohol dehydrogenase family)
MAEKKTILVWGATGAQGGSVVSHLLASGLFNVRGATRNKDSDAAKALAEKVRRGSGCFFFFCRHSSCFFFFFLFCFF